MSDIKESIGQTRTGGWPEVRGIEEDYEESPEVISFSSQSDTEDRTTVKGIEEDYDE